jgi:hypothetical protein
MIPRLIFGFVLLLVSVAAVHAQTTSQPPFAALDRAVKAQRGGWDGDHSQLSAIFAAERRQLGDRFEAELLKWLGKDMEKHYWIPLFLEANDYLHGNKRLPYLALLVLEQGLSLVRNKNDEESQGYVVSLSISAATLSAELGFSSLAISYKDKAEALLKSDSDLKAHVPAMYEADRQRYDNIPSSAASSKVAPSTGAPSTGASPPTIVADPNPPPYARVTGGILNGKAVKLPKPIFPPEAHRAGAAGEVIVSIVFDEQGKVVWARATSGHPLLRTACEDAAWQSTFPPLKLAGQPVKVKGVLIYNFVL